MKVLLASFEPRRDRTLAGWRFVRKPTRHASSRQFESQPTKTRGRYEPTLNARPDRTIRQFGAARGRDTDMTAATVVVLNAAWAKAAHPTLTEPVLVGGARNGQQHGSG
jgi:hypothetical protein